MTPRPTADPTIGARIQARRLLRGWSIRYAASRAGLAHTTWSRIERGLQAADNRFTLADIAAALECAPAELAGTPVPASDRAAVAAQSAVQAVRRSLASLDLAPSAILLTGGTPFSDRSTRSKRIPADGERRPSERQPSEPQPGGEPRPIGHLARTLQLLDGLRQACDYAGAARLIPDLLRDLHLAATGPEREPALRMLCDVTFIASSVLRNLGHPADAWLGAERCQDAAALTNHPADSPGDPNAHASNAATRMRGNADRTSDTATPMPGNADRTSDTATPMPGNAAHASDTADRMRGYADRTSDTAGPTGDPVLLAYAAYARASAATACGAFGRSLTLASQAVDALAPHQGIPGAPEMRGSLQLICAYASRGLGRLDDSRAWTTEAAELAAHTGETTTMGLYFGPTNVNIWRIGIEADGGDPGLAAEIARQTDPARVPAGFRQVFFYADTARALARLRDREAIRFLLIAERVAPQHVHTSALARETSRALLDRARRAAGGTELRGLCERLQLA
jgi:transcriptional regulator with XRE-family HTH domain